MRTLLAVVLLLVSTIAAAEEPKALSIVVEPLGDQDPGVVARLYFRFANPRATTHAGLFLEGSISQEGHVPRNFRFAVPRKGDRFVWHNTTYRNSKLIRHTRWSLLPDQRNEMAMDHKFAAGKAEITAWLVLEGDYGNGPTLVAQASETVTLARTNRPLAVEDDEIVTEEEEDAPIEVAGAVTIRPPRQNALSNMYLVSVDVLPPVKRVEFRVGDKKILARNAPPYSAELDLGESPQGVALRAIGYDAKGHYVDADALVLNDTETRISVMITRTVTSDGVSYVKLTVRNYGGAPLKSVALYAGAEKLREWSGPPFTLSIPNDRLTGVIRAIVTDESGFEASAELPSM